MRIGIVTGEYPPMQGGVGAYTSILAAELAQQEQQVFILSSSQAQNSDSRITLDNSTEKWTFGDLNRIRAWAAQARLEVINIQFQTAAYGMSPWIHLLPDVMQNIPVVTTFHDLRFPYLFPKAGKLREWVVMHLARTSQGIIVTNHEDDKRLSFLKNRALIPIGSNILQALPTDFDAKSWREKACAKPGDFLIAYFGLVNRSKGLEILLESLHDLRAQNVPARLVIIGGGAGSSDPTNATFATEIQTFIKKLDLQDAVYETGFVDEQVVGAFLSASDVVALPFLDGASYRRGSLMAAIHYGCAIVTTKPEVEISSFRNDENMLLVPPADRAGLTHALEQLYHAPELRQQLQAGAATLSHEFGWSQIAHSHIEFFRRVAA